MRPQLNVDVPGAPEPGESQRVSDVSNMILIDLLNTVYIVAGLVAVIGIVMGGFWYVTSNGEADKVKRGKNAIIYSVVGVVIVMMAFGITGFISGRIGV